MGDIFDRCMIEWEPMKELILNGIFESVQVLKSFTFLGVLNEVLSLVAHTVATAEWMKIRMDWLNEVCRWENRPKQPSLWRARFLGNITILKN